ncbi:hypothetical protein ACFORL_05690 [Legionella dresdenensis]|uniref:Uncharacterized protein n=1 Tax=Legionella dresdenensis TaxID=450200 RepID=A0ABV8CF33_9GAMM
MLKFVQFDFWVINVFDTVYRIAIETNDFEELKSKLKELHVDTLGLKDGFLVTVGAQLARECKHDKVEWMRQLGANVDTIAFGYAQAGNHDKVEAYRQLGAGVDTIACGYAYAGCHDKVEAYRQLGAGVNIIAFGYVLAGNHDKVEAYRQLGAGVTTIAFGYALTGNHDKVEAYRHLGADVHKIGFGYTLAGNHEKVKAYRQHGVDIKGIAYGYVVASNHDAVETREKSRRRAKVTVEEPPHLVGVPPYLAIRSGADADYALVRNREKEKKYDIKYNLIDTLDKYLKKRSTVVDSSGKTKEYFYGSFFSVFQKSFKQKSDAVKALQLALEGYKVDLNPHLSTLRNGHLGKVLREFIQTGIGVGKEVTTVSGFIQALQEENFKAVQSF